MVLQATHKSAYHLGTFDIYLLRRDLPPATVGTVTLDLAQHLADDGLVLGKR